MDTIADYEAWKSNKQQGAVGAANVVLGSVDAKPDEVAGDLTIGSEFAKTTGNPVPPLPMVTEYRSLFQQKIDEAKNQTILSTSPRLTEWLRNPENAAVAKDDLTGLSWWETGLGAAGNAIGRGVQRVPMSYNQFMANGATQRMEDQKKSFGDMLSDETTVRDSKGNVIYDRGLPSPIDLFAAGSRFATSRFSELFAGPDAAKNAATYYQQQVGLINKRISEIPMSPAGETGRKNWLEVKPTGDVTADIGAYIGSITKDPKSFLAFAGETAAESLPSLAAAAGVTMATRNPTAGAVFMGANSAATEMGTAPADVFKEHGFDISTPEGAAAVIANPDVMREAIKRGNARGVFIGLMDGLSGGVAGKMLAESHVGNMVLQSLTQAAMGAAGEAGGQALAGQKLNIGDILMEGFAEFATAPIEVAGVGGRKLIEGRQKAKAAGERKALFQALSGEAQNSALRNRLPDKFRQFVEKATENGPVENVYVPADQFTQYFQSKGLDPNTIVDELEGVTRDDLDAAIAGGGDLQIPTATYAAKLAGTEHDAFLMENMRFDPDEFTSAEAKAFNEKAQDALQEAFDVADKMRQHEDSLRSVEQTIYDTMVSRLRVAGRSTDVATSEAMLYPAFYRVMAERSGMTPEDFMARYPLPEVKGSIPEGMQFRNVDELNRTLAEARGRKSVRDNRQTLLEFIDAHGGINDVGGELRSRDAETIKRGPGKKTLKLARSGVMAGMRDIFGAGDGKRFGADDVALAAIDAGFLGDDPIANEYRAALNEGRQVPDITAALWDAIDRELQGQPQYSSHQAPDPAVDEAAKLDGIEEYLAGLGVSLSDSDEKIRAAVEGDGKRYGQPAYHGTPHLFEKFSTDSIGTGEGAQSFGWGLYFAGNKEIAEYYRNSVGGRHGAVVVDGAVFSSGSKPLEKQTAIERAATFARTALDQNETVVAIARRIRNAARIAQNSPGELTSFQREGGWGNAEVLAETADILDDWAAKDVQKAGRTFQVDIPDDSELMAWDAPLSEQPKAIKEKLAALGISEPPAPRRLADPDLRYIIEKAVKDNDGDPDGVAMIVDNDHALYQRAERLAKKRGDAIDDDGVGAYVENLARSYLDGLRGRSTYTGEKIYRELSQRLGKESGKTELGWTNTDAVPKDDRAASEALRAAGIPGHKFLDGGSRSAGSGSYNYVIYDDSRVKVTNFEQGAPTGPRGSVQFPSAGVGNGDTVISLFQSADLSTFLHESGHYFLTVMQDLAAKGEANAASDFAVVKNWWRENAADVAKDAARATPGITAEDVISALDNGTTGDAIKDAAIDIGMQEQWARAMEAYFMDGKAPSVELRGAFEKFRAWLISIYRKLAGLNVKPSEELRGVFDRMLASDAEIAQANTESGDTGPLFPNAEQMGLTPEQYDAFLKLRSQAEDEAKARLLRETMAPIKRQQEKWFKEERAKVRDDVEREINARPYYRAWEWMGNRRWFGEGQPEDMPDMRLSKDVLVAVYGEGVLKTLPRGKQTIYAVDGGMDPDEAAGWFGFGSGDEMIKALERAPKRNEAIEAETDRLMNERHGDVLNDGSIEAEALDAVHTDKRGQWIAAELKAVVEIAGTGDMMTAKEARASARQTIGRMRVRDAMNANRFLAAERKAAEEAGRLGAMLAREKVWLDAARRKIGTTARAALRGEGSVDAVAGAIEANNKKFETTSTTFEVGAQERVSSAGNAFTVPAGERTTTNLGYNDLVAKLIDTKRKQLLNHAFYTEARKMADEVEKAENFVNKLGSKTTREKIAGAGRREGAQIDYLSAIDELLERYDFRRMSGAAEQRRGSLLSFVEAMKAAGRENELAIPADVLARAAQAPYKTLPVEELRGVIDTLKNLEHVALRWNKLIDAQQQRDRDAAVADIVTAFDENVKKRPPGRVGSKGEKTRNTVRQFLDLVLNATTLLREIDGFKDAGAAYRNIKAPIDDAMGRLIVRKEKAAADLEALYSVYSKEERRRMTVREHMPELGYALSKWEMIAVALNTGNDGNYQRLTDPKVRGSLTEAQVAAVIGRLDNRDADFVQSVWDYVGSFWSDIAARERRTTGVEPARVEGTPTSIGTRSLKGGYYPLKYDPRLSSLARDDAENEIWQSMQAGRFGKAQTRNGHLKARTQSSGRAVELDMSVLHRHINQVVYDLELSEPVTNSWRILQDANVRDKFVDAGKQADYDALETWMLDVGQGEIRSADLAGRASRTLKSNFTAAKLALNFATAAVQVSGVAQSMVVVGKKDFLVGLQASFRPGMAGEIAAKSAYMKTRQTTFNKDIYDFYNDPKTGPIASRWGDIKSEIIGPLSFWMMTKTQWALVDVPTWLAGYHQGLRRFGNDEAKAIAHADDIVKRSQASGMFSDRSAIERGSVQRSGNGRQSDVVRLFTALGSYMFAKFNVAYERSARAGRVFSEEGVSLRSAQEALSLTVDYAFLFTLEAVMTAAIKSQLPRDDDDKNDSWLKFLAKQTGFSVMSTIPGVRDVASALQGFDGGGAYGSAMGDAAKGVGGIWNIVSHFFTGDEVKRSDIKAVINATGLATGLPATQINRVVDAKMREVEGEDVSPLEYLLGKIKK